ncbi:MAG: riboflavin biosynthesis protein RibF [Armatimonadota bacterium]
MQLHFGVDLLLPEWSGCVACIGTFDGVHVGHKTLLTTAHEEAAKHELPSVVVTFDRHPAAVLNPARKPASLASLEQNLAEFEKVGVAMALVLPFDERMAATTATEFLENVLKNPLKAAKLVVGHDFAMGHAREGTAAWLAERIPTLIHQPVTVEEHRVSSTAIRKAVATGNVGLAHRMLGRPYSLGGVVVSGQKLGRTLGYPTANIARTNDQALPADGIYAGQLKTKHGLFKAAISIGMRPAVKGKHRTVEAYLIDYPGDSLYGDAVECEFWVRLRDELDFPTLDELENQIAADVSVVSSVPMYGLPR